MIAKRVFYRFKAIPHNSDCGSRSQIFRQVGQIIGAHTNVWALIFGQADGTICKQGARHELCGIALTFISV